MHIDGGVAAITTTPDAIVVGGHFNNWCQGIKASGSPVKCTTPVVRRHLLAANPATGAVLPWAPSVNSDLGVFAARAVSGTMWVGGDFTSIGTANGLNHLARFTY